MSGLNLGLDLIASGLDLGLTLFWPR